MKIELIRANDGSLKGKIKEQLAWAHTFHLGVAYATIDAYEIIRTNLETFLRKNGRIKAVFDIEKFITDHKILNEFSTIGGDCECKVFLNKQASQRKAYHPKFYLFFDDSNYSAIIGSSNFTKGGIDRNIESNVFITGSHDQFFKSLKEEFSIFWKHENSINIVDHTDILEEYMHLQTSAVAEQSRSAAKLKKLNQQLEQKINSVAGAKKLVLNENFGYLLGLLIGHGKLDFKNNQLEIILQRGIANRNTEYEGFYFNPDISHYKIAQVEAHNRDIERIAEKLFELLLSFSNKDDIDYFHDRDLIFKVVIRFSKNSPLKKALSDYNLPLDNEQVVAHVPDAIKKSENKKIITAFLKGYCDVRSRISASDGIYKVEKGRKKIYSSLRMGISVSHNGASFLSDLVGLFNKAGISQGLSHTNPSVRTKENLIRIDVKHVPYGLLGTHWRRIFLKDFQYYINANKRKYDPNQLTLI